MTVSGLRISEHAELRMAQRNLDTDEVATVMRWGRCEHRAGAEFYFLGWRDMPKGMERALVRLVGATVVVEHGRVSTVYRNKRALSNIRRKPKRVGRAARASRLKRRT